MGTSLGLSIFERLVRRVRRNSQRGGERCDSWAELLDTHRTVEAIWRMESPKLIASLTRLVRDVGVAEELAQDAFVSALSQWPESGIPRNPGAWLMAIGKRRAIDAALYDALAQVVPSPVVRLNRAVAVAMAYGPAAGLELVDALTTEPALRTYHLLPSVRGDLLEKLSRFSEARDEFERAASLAHNTRDRALLLEPAARCAWS